MQGEGGQPQVDWGDSAAGEIDWGETIADEPVGGK